MKEQIQNDKLQQKRVIHFFILSQACQLDTRKHFGDHDELPKVIRSAFVIKNFPYFSEKIIFLET